MAKNLISEMPAHSNLYCQCYEHINIVEKQSRSKIKRNCAENKKINNLMQIRGLHTLMSCFKHQ